MRERESLRLAVLVVDEKSIAQNSPGETRLIELYECTYKPVSHNSLLYNSFPPRDITCRRNITVVFAFS